MPRQAREVLPVLIDYYQDPSRGKGSAYGVGRCDLARGLGGQAGGPADNGMVPDRSRQGPAAIRSLCGRPNGEGVKREPGEVW